MINEKIEDALNQQLNAEYASAYLYLSMSAHFQSANLPGMAHWMHLQFGEEQEHAKKIFHFILERGGKVTLTEIMGPKSQWGSPLEVFEDSYKHECGISKQIDDLVDLATRENDHPAIAFLQWFVSEQVEEEANVLLAVERLKMAGDNSVALLMLDEQLGSRTMVSA